MLDLYVGGPGAGKSYEVTRYRILPALQEGRKVVTNLAVNHARMIIAAGCAPDLLVILPERINGRWWGSSVEDYDQSWQDAEGKRCLFVIDECHRPLPSRNTSVELEEWYSMHRHKGYDVVLLSQSSRKVNAVIMDMVQTSISLRKATALGSSKTYLRFVLDGVKGKPISKTVRPYDKRFFSLYASHTGSKGPIKESGSKEKGVFSHWIFKVIGLFAIFIVYQGIKLASMVDDGETVLTSESSKDVVEVPNDKKENAVKLPVVEKLEDANRADQVDKKEVVEDKQGGHPLASFELVYHGTFNGQALLTGGGNLWRGGELTAMGYSVSPVSLCAARIEWGEWSHIIGCAKGRVGAVAAVSSTLY